MNPLEECKLCPVNCKVNRLIGNLGKCKCGAKAKVALASLHNYEEPCISGENGSGTVFFTSCNLRCKFCQNYKISSNNQKGEEVTENELANIFIDLQNKNAENINLVTPTMYVIPIIEAIKIARKKGLKIPIIYNTNGYENIETIKMLEGYIDVYLPDFKYAENSLANYCSGISNYVEITKEAIKEMIKQVGQVHFDGRGMITKGVIIRHLILPNNTQNTKNILKWIDENLGSKTYISIMAQYFPAHLAKQDKLLNRKITKKEYEKIEDFLFSLNLENGYIQDLGEHEEEYVPEF